MKSVFESYEYASLENPERRSIARTDPQGFLSGYKKNLIIDEVQYVPELLSYIQEIVDNENKPARFILTGSQSLLMLEKITQSLAGRTALLKLLPFSMDELQTAGFDTKTDYCKWIYTGFFPRIFDADILPGDFYPAYFETYVQRDVRQIQNVKDLDRFSNFVSLCAGRVGQILDYSSLANDAGVSVNTTKGWISVLQAGYIIFLLQPYYKNVNKRVIKSPKLYFTDTGLVSFLLNINSGDQLTNHYLRGNLFENFILLEILKYRLNSGIPPNLFYYRDNNRNEIDCIIEKANTLDVIEIKSGQTFSDNFLKSLNFWEKHFSHFNSKRYLVYGGTLKTEYKNINIVPWNELVNIL